MVRQLKQAQFVLVIKIPLPFVENLKRADHPAVCTEQRYTEHAFGLVSQLSIDLPIDLFPKFATRNSLQLATLDNLADDTRIVGDPQFS
jgi:hypothetical protein